MKSVQYYCVRNFFHQIFKNKRRVYLDHAAATPLLKEALRAMQPYLSESFGNASAIHAEGAVARQAVESARESVARTLRVRATDVTFTSGGTESNNLALLGHVAALHAAGVRNGDIEIIATKTEHPSISKVLERLEKEGCVVRYVSVTKDGLVDIAQLRELLSYKTRLVTVAYANSETGVIQDVNKIGRTIAAFERTAGIRILLHTDASQAPLWLPCAPEQSHADMVTLDAGKFGGPKGIGLLIHRPRATLLPTVYGGSQERDLRPGTENVAAIVGCATALQIAQRDVTVRSARVQNVRDFGIKVLRKLNNVVLNGSQHQRLPNNINISIPDVDTEFAVVVLDTHGIAASTKSACSGAGSGRSDVVYAMTGDEARARSTIRLTLGEQTKKRDLKKVAKVLKTHIDKMNRF